MKSEKLKIEAVIKKFEDKKLRRWKVKLNFSISRLLNFFFLLITRHSSLVTILLFTVHYSLFTPVHAEVVERIVAIVNDDIILLSEYEDALRSAREADSSVSGEVVLNRMIDDLLLLNEAKKFRIGVSDKGRKTVVDAGAVISEYIDRRIKAFIIIPPEDIEDYYLKNKDLFANKDLYDVRDEIEERLVKKELEIRLQEYMEELRKKAYIRVQY